MRLLLLCFFLLCSTITIAKGQDSTSVPKLRENLFEIGYVAASFFDGEGMAFHHSRTQSEFEHSFLPSSFSYSRFSNTFFVKAGFYRYSNYYRGAVQIRQGNLTPELIKRSYNNFSLSGGIHMSLLSVKPIKMFWKNAIDVNYRYNGMELWSLGFPAYSWHGNFGTNPLKSIGFGVSSGLQIMIGSRFCVSPEIGYTHYFDKKNLSMVSESSDFYKHYQPSRDLISIHLKAGILFGDPNLKSLMTKLKKRPSN